MTQSEYASILTGYSIGSQYYFAIHFRNGYAFFCQGYFKGLGQQANEGDNLVKMPITIKFTGAPSMLTHAAADAL